VLVVTTSSWLVVWNIIFPYIGNVIIPTEFHIFQRARAQPPTSKWHTVIQKDLEMRPARKSVAFPEDLSAWFCLSGAKFSVGKCCCLFLTLLNLRFPQVVEVMDHTIVLLNLSQYISSRQFPRSNFPQSAFFFYLNRTFQWGSLLETTTQVKWVKIIKVRTLKWTYSLQRQAIFSGGLKVWLFASHFWSSLYKFSIARRTD
jgi:hypothetical protein